MRRLLLPLLLIASAASAQPKAGTDTMEMDSSHAKVTVTSRGTQGRFETVAGALQYDPVRPDTSTLALSLDASSIGDATVRQALDTDHFPELRIASTAGIKAGMMPMIVTIRDVTRSVPFQISFKPLSSGVVALHAEGTLKSGAFHLGGDMPVVIDAAFKKVDPTKPLP